MTKSKFKRTRKMLGHLIISYMLVYIHFVRKEIDEIYG